MAGPRRDSRSRSRTSLDARDNAKTSNDQASLPPPTIQSLLFEILSSRIVRCIESELFQLTRPSIRDCTEDFSVQKAWIAYLTLKAAQVIVPIMCNSILYQVKFLWTSSIIVNSVDQPLLYSGILQLAREKSEESNSLRFKLHGQHEKRTADGQLKPLAGGTEEPFWHNGTRFTVEYLNTNSISRDVPSSVQPLGLVPWPGSSASQLAISCFGLSNEPVNKLLDEVNERVVQSQRLNVIEIQAGATDRLQQRNKRPLSMVDLDPELMDEITKDVQQFFRKDTLAWYTSIGQPYRRGYLLHGPPGTGKTTLSTALASHCDIPLVIITLLGMDDIKLKEAFDRAPSKSIILLEDIDCAGADVSSHGAQATDNGFEQAQAGSSIPGILQTEVTSSSLSLSGLLNVIDGVNAKEGRIMVMTTNHPKKLDPALYRPGRIDCKFELGYANKQSALLTFKRLFDNDVPKRYTTDAISRFAKAFHDQFPSNSKVTTAELCKYFGQYRGRPDKAVEEFAHWLEVGADKFTCPMDYIQSNDEDGVYNVPEPFDRSLLQVSSSDLVNTEVGATNTVPSEVHTARSQWSTLSRKQGSANKELTNTGCAPRLRRCCVGIGLASLPIFSLRNVFPIPYRLINIVGRAGLVPSGGGVG
ncbi:P-loop containing nucleoside triphosphate hydrolase protein [Cucurbitaria berberidis CBS 394.84]|uniref:P-loop containing nucleoside triphosphate hydrolase protein n=1 Tax=Cucurbitaria berberidis CBS 394.84 TaxID=1168544 RepID=A0A9P4G7D4_9PLEO|nr:P-loop containing nucleoside triphosphate hydrolase protein [Cucurbitaria berberidis CBS 394.84]KAF1840281.1 P-loop containing nucleoside triphosphate hydrolase protein [Cucurbitaria berberidis CBS 394.84]